MSRSTLRTYADSLLDVVRGGPRTLQEGLRSRLIHHCALCSQWIVSPKLVKAHIRRSHSQLWDVANPSALLYCKQHSSALGSSTTCKLCGAQVAAQQQQGAVEPPSQAATPGQSSGHDASMTDATEGTPQKWAKTKEKGGAGKGNRDYQSGRNQWWQSSKNDMQQKDMEEIVLTGAADDPARERAFLFLDTKDVLALIMEWKARLEKTLQDENLRKIAQDAEWLTLAPPFAWSFHKWDPAKKETYSVDGRALSGGPAPGGFERPMPAAGRPTIHWFHATRPMSETYQSDVFFLTISQKGEVAAAVHKALEGLIGCSACRVIGMAAYSATFGDLAGQARSSAAILGVRLINRQPQQSLLCSCKHSCTALADDLGCLVQADGLAADCCASGSS